MPNNQSIEAIYATYVTALLGSESKRQTANQVYLSLSLALVTASTTIEDFPEELGAGMLLFVAIIWIFTIGSYRALSRAKFSVILEMEKKLAFAPFTHEWDYISNGQKLMGITRLEMIAPSVLVAFAIYMYLGA